MQEVRIQNQSRPLNKPLSAHYCSSFFCRLRGLTFRRSIPNNWGLLLVQKKENRSDSAIHMLFVCFDLTIVWIDSNFKVVDKKFAKAWHLLYRPERPAVYVLELSSKRINDFCIGDQVNFEQYQK